MTACPDVLILGGGVIGVTTAYYLAREGARVTVLDRGEPGQESSWAGAGIISSAPAPGRAQDPYQQLATLSAEHHPRFAQLLREETGIDTGYLQRGGWELFSSASQVPVANWQSLGIPFEQADPGRVRELEPALAPGGHAVCYLPQTAQVRNPRHLKALLAIAGRVGVQFRPGCPALGFEQGAGRVNAVRTVQGSFAAGQYLIASGAWSDSLLEPLGFRPGIRPVRGQIALLRSPLPVISRIVEVGKRYLVPRPDGRVLVGSTEEDAGFEKRTTAGAIAELIRFATGLVPALEQASVERCWAGLRPGSPDGKPFLGPVPGLANLFVAAGHYRIGIQLSCATAQVMTELLLGRPLSVPLEAFRLDRGT